MNVNLIIEGQTVDIDPSVTISITDSISNAREPDKVFGAYSNTFLLPATSLNAKIFNRWEYESNLSGWDARYSAEAQILINGASWLKGKVRLLSASTELGKAKDYRVAFTGQISNLKEILGDDTLDQLDFSAYDHEYTEANVRTGLTTSLSSGVIRYPLIYHTTRYFYTTQFTDADGNALNHTELKPAIQLVEIMNAIEDKYDITWASGGFWDDTLFDSFYMWCHRTAGNISGGSEQQEVEISSTEFSYESGTNVLPIETFSTSRGVPVAPQTYDINYTITPNDSSLYDVVIIDENSGTEISRWVDRSGADTFSVTVSSGEARIWAPKLIVYTTDGLGSFTVSLTLDKTRLAFGVPVVTSGVYDEGDQTWLLNSFMRIQSQIPKMKIVDFLTGLFKMFNLTAYYNDDDEIEVQTLDDFYDSGTIWELDKYLDVNYPVSRIAPYSQIDFKFEDKASKLAIKWDEEFSTNESTTYGFSRRFGELSYVDTQKKFDGGTYSIDVPFEKMLFERQIASSGSKTQLQSGWFVDEDNEPAVGAPLIMYLNNYDCNLTPIRWATLSNSITYNRPSNIDRIITNSIHFNAEIDPYEGEVEEKSLFSVYWANYIGELYNKQARKYKITGKLPAKFIQNYSLADEIHAFGIRFRIEDIKINLNTGDANLTLRNIPEVLPA